jgi:hypothetical protein
VCVVDSVEAELRKWTRANPPIVQSISVGESYKVSGGARTMTQACQGLAKSGSGRVVQPVECKS